jgi:uncharacterized membrane protein YGL010W
MLSPPRPPAPIVEDWYHRHRQPVNFVVHLVGIPPTILGVLLVPVWLALASVSLFLFALALFVGGYLLQFLGHIVDGSEPGELAYLRKRFARSRFGTQVRFVLSRWIDHRAARTTARQ